MDLIAQYESDPEEKEIKAETLPFAIASQSSSNESVQSQRHKKPRKSPGTNTGPSTLLAPSSEAVSLLRFGHGLHERSLLAAALMSGAVKVWRIPPALDLTTEWEKPFLSLTPHKKGVPDLRWSHDSTRILTGGFDEVAIITDLQAPTTPLMTFEHQEFVTAVCYHPEDPHTFVSGGSRSGLYCWDTRAGTPAFRVPADCHKVFKGASGQVLDMAFLSPTLLVTSTDLVTQSTFDKTLLVWDFRLAAVVSGQVYRESYSCPAVRLHPAGQEFVAQSNGGYIAIFSASSPFKIDKTRRFQGHQVSGHRIQCNFDVTGRRLATGSADGRVRIFDWKTARTLHTFQAHSGPCVEVAFHPAPHSTLVATASWAGEVTLWGT